MSENWKLEYVKEFKKVLFFTKLKDSKNVSLLMNINFQDGSNVKTKRRINVDKTNL